MEFCRGPARLFLLLLFSKSPVIYFESRRKIKLKRGKKNMKKKTRRRRRNRPTGFFAGTLTPRLDDPLTIIRSVGPSPRAAGARVSRPVCIFLVFLYFPFRIQRVNQPKSCPKISEPTKGLHGVRRSIRTHTTPFGLGPTPTTTTTTTITQPQPQPPPQ